MSAAAGQRGAPAPAAPGQDVSGGAAAPLRVLRVITRLPPGGIERRMVALLPRLRSRGVEPEVAILHKMGGLTDDLAALGVPVHFCPFPTRLHPGALLRLARLVRERRIDLVHAHMYRANVPATVAARLAGRPVLAQVHNVGTWETRRQRWMDRLLLRWRAGMVAVSERVADDVARTLGCPRERLHVLYNGVDLARFGVRFAPGGEAARAATRAGLGLEADEVAFLCPARLHPQKNLRALVAAAARGIGGGATRVALLLAGDGAERAALEAEAAAVAPPVRVLFLGHRDDMPVLYAAADAMVLPSLKEGFSNAVIEAMASGLPVVVSDVGGNAEALGHSGAGLLLGPRPDAAEIAAALDRLARDPAARAAMGEAARRRARAFDLEEMADATVRLYRSVCGAPRGAAGARP